MSANTKVEQVAATCSVELSSAEIFANTDVKLQVKIACVPACDLEGQTVEIKDEGGATLAAAELGPYDEEADANAVDLSARAPAVAGSYVWTAHLPAYEGDGVRYDEATAQITLTVREHTTSVLVWDVPSAVVAGETFKIKVGIKCSGQCRQADRDFTIIDETGTEIAAAAVGAEVWPKSAALYYTELQLTAPSSAGLQRWEVRCPAADESPEGSDAVLPHASGSAAFGVRCVNVPDVKVRVEAWDAMKGSPLTGARVVLHPYGATTDEQGVAEVMVTRGQYRLFVSRPKYTTFGTPVDVSQDLSTRVELSLEPPPDRE